MCNFEYFEYFVWLSFLSDILLSSDIFLQVLIYIFSLTWCVETDRAFRFLFFSIRDGDSDMVGLLIGGELVL